MFTIRTDGYALGDDPQGVVRCLNEDDDGRVSVTFDDPEERYYDDPEALEAIDKTAVASWCTSAFIDVDGNELIFGFSTGDPRGGFVMTVRRLDNGQILIHVPHGGMTSAHEDLEPLHEGTLVIKRSKNSLPDED